MFDYHLIDPASGWAFLALAVRLPGVRNFTADRLSREFQFATARRRTWQTHSCPMDLTRPDSSWISISDACRVAANLGSGTMAHGIGGGYGYITPEGVEELVIKYTIPSESLLRNPVDASKPGGPFRIANLSI